MPFPTTEDGLIKAGYEPPKKSTHCRCGAEIEFWRTPKGKQIPLNAGDLTPHWADCPIAKEFR